MKIQQIIIILSMQITEEADLVSLRIVELLSQKGGFTCQSLDLTLLFQGVVSRYIWKPLFRWGNFVRPISQRMNLCFEW